MTQILTKSKRREGRVKSDYGIKDYYNFFKTEYPDLKISYKKFKSVITDFNKSIVDSIIEEGLEYTFPYIGSSLSIMKDKRIPRIVNGKLYNPAPVDWVSTNTLWASNEEAREKKLLVRYNNTHTSKYVFRIHFRKYMQNFKNKNLYKFITTRDFKRDLGKRINDEDKDPYESYLLYNKI